MKLRQVHEVFTDNNEILLNGMKNVHAF